MKKTIYNIITVIICLAAIFYPIISGIINLTNKSDYHEENIIAATGLITIEHSISGLIPTGKDYYYIGVSDDGKSTFLITGPKNWLEDKFDENGLAYNTESVKVTGLAKHISDYDVSKEISSYTAQMQNTEFPLGEDTCLDVSYKTDAVKRIIAGTLLLIAGIMGIAIFTTNKFINKPVALIILIISFFGGGALLINILQ